MVVKGKVERARGVMAARLATAFSHRAKWCPLTSSQPYRLFVARPFVSSVASWVNCIDTVALVAATASSAAAKCRVQWGASVAAPGPLSSLLEGLPG